MTVTISSPATIFELADLAGAMSRAHWSVAKAMWRGGGTFAFRADGELVALAGLFPMTLPDGGEVTEMWFCPAPGAGRHMLGITRLSKLTIASSAYRGIYTICRTEPGKRFARALGLHPAGSSELGEIWAYGGPSDGQGSQGRAEGAGRHPGREPAPVARQDGVRAG